MPRPGWRLSLATTLLIAGVIICGDPHLLVKVAGGLCVFFVPALIFDEITIVTKRR